MKRVIVIGLDGFDPHLTEPLLASGALPNLAKLRSQGGYARVRTTTPAQTPVAWSTFATGVNPGGHGIFDFIWRNPQTYLPELSFTRYEQKKPVHATASNQSAARSAALAITDQSRLAFGHRAFSLHLSAR